MSLKNGLNGKTAQPLVVTEPESEQGTVLVHLSVLAVQLSRSFVLTIQVVQVRYGSYMLTLVVYCFS